MEASEPRALPVASFIARQRDLWEFVGDQYTEPNKIASATLSNIGMAAFNVIKLEDRNLPVIVQKRLLKPVNESARIQIDGAFDAMDSKMREEIASILLTNQVIVSSSVLSIHLVRRWCKHWSPCRQRCKRERTALKVMLMLLVQQRDTLELGSVIPVGICMM